MGVDDWVGSLRLRRVAGWVAPALLVGVVAVAAAGVPADARVGAAKQAVLKRAAGEKAGQLAQRVRSARLRRVDLSCLASFQFDFSPALDNNTVSSQTTAALTGCVSPDGSHSGLLSAVLFAGRGHSTAAGGQPGGELRMDVFTH